MNQSGVSASIAQLMELFEQDAKAAAFRAREFLKRYPGQQQALMLLVSARRVSGDLAGGRNMLQQLAKADPDLAAIQYELGALLADMGESEAAIAALSRAAELEPLHKEAWRGLGDVLARTGRREEAAQAYGRCFAIVSTPDAPGVASPQERL